MADQADGTGAANAATVTTEPNSVDRPASVPESYVWDPEIGPTDDGKPTGAWREPTTKEGK